MRRYPAYRDSGVEWLGEVPEGWEVRRFKTFLLEREERSADGSETLLSVSAYTGVTPRSEHIDEGDFITRAESLEGYKVCFAGDLVMNIMLAWNRAQGVSPHGGIVSPAYAVFELTTAIHPAYLNYLVRSNEYCLYFKAHSAGVIDSRLRLYPEQFGALHCIFPPLPEQTAIATFLDRETAKIDALVAEQRRLIELLREKRQAVISHAVTKGLNPNAPLKPSGIDWLGDVPEGWEVGPLKRFVKFLDGKRIPLSSEERGTRSGDYPYYGASGVIDWIDDYIFDEDLVLVSEDGANLLARASPIAFVARGKYWVNNHAHILKPIDGEVVYWAERIEEIDLTPYVTGSAQPKLTVDALANLVVSAPMRTAQRSEIALEIAFARERFDPVIGAAETAIALLQERRAALISAAVTGKIDVRPLVRKEDEAA